MDKKLLNNILCSLNRSDKVVANFKEENFPCIILAGIQPLYLITFRIDLAKMPTTDVLAIGRENYCDFQIPATLPRISRLHCYIEKCDDGSYCIHDVSLYGTSVQMNPESPAFKKKLKNFFQSL